MNKREFKVVYKTLISLMEAKAVHELSFPYFSEYKPLEDYLKYLNTVSFNVFIKANFIYLNKYQKLKDYVKKDMFTPRFKNVITGEFLTKYECMMYEYDEVRNRLI